MNDWIMKGSCLNVRSDIFYPPELPDDDGTAGYTAEQYQEAYGPAREICATCPVKIRCLEHALDKKERWGVWGGLIPIERLRIERKWRRQRLRVRRASEGHEGPYIEGTLEDDDV